MSEMSKTKVAVYTIGFIIIGALLIFGDKLARLYYTVTLFNEDQIVENFSSMTELYNTSEIKTNGPASTFESQPKPLPQTFSFKGKIFNTENYLNETSTTALLVVKGNTITHEDYRLDTQTDDHRITWSVAKSLLSAVFGIAVEEGHIKSIQDKVTDYVPELAGSGYDGVRIKDVLQMSSGVRFDENYDDSNSDINRFGRTFALGGSFDDFATSLVRENEPGTMHHYVSIDTHVLGMVLRAATGKSIETYLYEKIWSRIQPEASAFYIIDDERQPMVLGGLNLRTRDFARFGMLYANYGRWNGEQVIPYHWVIDSITPDAPHLMPGVRDTSHINLGYGYQWWLPERADQEFMAIGIYDQYIFVDQKANVVIVKNSAHIDFMKNNFEAASKTAEMFRAIVRSLDD